MAHASDEAQTTSPAYDGSSITSRLASRPGRQSFWCEIPGLDKLPAGVFYENVTKRQKPVIFYLDSPWTPDAGYATSLYFDDKSYVDYSNYSNPQVNELIERGLLTTDDAERTKIYDEVQRAVMAEAPWGLIAYPKYALARKKNLKGFTYYTSNNLRFQDFHRA